MADNKTLPLTGSGDATAAVRTIDKAGIHTQSVALDVGGAGAESFLVRGQQTMANSLPVVIASDQGIGGGTQYTEDAAAAADPVGTMAMAVRADSLAAVTSADGDNIAARATNKGELYVKHVDAIPVTDNGGSLTIDNAALSVAGGGAEASALRVTIATDSTGVLSIDDNGGSLTVDGTVTANAGSGNFNVIGPDAHDAAVAGNPVVAAGRASAAAPTDVSADGDVVRAWHLRNGAQATVLTAAGALIGGDATNGLDVDVTRISGTVTVDSELPAAAALADAASNPTVPMVGGANLVFNGTTWDRARGDTTNGLDVDVTRVQGSVTVAQATASNLNAQVTGTVASDGVDSGNPVKIGGQARSSDITTVANADRVDFIADLNGKQITMPYAMPENFIAGKTADITGTTDTAVIAAQGAGVRIYVTQLTITNSHATVGTWVNIKDGTTAIYTVFAAAAGGGATITLPAPLRLTANTALNAANETTASNTRVSASGYKAP